MKRKVKVITNNFPHTFEYEINHFISTVTVVDIQYQMSANARNPLYTAMIIYEEW